MYAFLKYTFCFLLFFVHLNASGQTWTHFHEINKTNDIFDTGQELWIGTDAGLFVVNKTTLQVQHYTEENSNLASNDIEAITMDNNSTMWIGTYDDVFAYHQGGQFYNIAIPDSVSGQPTDNMLTYCMKADSSNNIWIGTNMGLLKYDGNQVSHYPVSSTYFGNIYNFEIADQQNFYTSGINFYHFDGNSTWTNIGYTGGPYHSNIHQQNDSTVWLFEFFGSIRKYNTNTQMVDSTYYASSSFTSPYFIAQDINDKSYILANAANVLAYWDGLSWQNTDTTLLKDVVGTITYLHIDDNNTAWAVAGTTLFKVENGVTTSTDLLTVGFPNGSTISANKSGSLYAFSIEEHLLGKIDITGTFNPIQLPYASSGTSTGALGHTTNGDLFIPKGNSIYQLTGTTWTSRPTPSTFWISGHDGLWGTDAFNLGYFQNGNWTAYSFSSPNSPYLGEIAVDTNNVLWAGCTQQSNHKVMSFDGSNPIVLYDSLNSDFKGYEVSSIYTDKNNDIWVANSIYVQHFDGNTWATYSPPNISTFGNEQITAIIYDNNNLYVGTKHDGLYILKNLSTWEQLTKANSELSADNITNLVLDKNNDLWIQSVATYSTGFSSISSRYIDVYSQNVTSTKSIEKVEQENNLKVLPNPASHYIQLGTAVEFDYPVQAQIINTLGQTVQQQLLHNTNERINIEQLIPSTYLLQIRTADKQYTQKFIKQ